MDLEENTDLFRTNIDDTKNKLRGRYKTEWVEESMIFDTKIEKQIPSFQTKSHLGNYFTINKFKSAFFSCLFVSILILSRIFYLQIIKGNFYRSSAEGNRQRIIPIAAERGLIFDRNGVQLTKNVPNFSLTIIPQNLPRNENDRENVIKKLASLSNQSEDELRKTLKEYEDYSYESVVIKEDLDYETALKIEIDAPDLPGIEIQRGSKRLYLSGTTATSSDKIVTSTPFSLAHVLGYQGKLNKEELKLLHEKGYLPSDYIGKTGLEKTYEQKLRGVYGKRRIEVNASGRVQNVLAEEAPIPGLHLKLSIDAKMQSKLEETIKYYLKSAHKTKASGIVMDPNNGQILALVSIPAFDDNDFSGGINQEKYSNYINDTDNPLFNRAIGGTYPSGSSIKPAIAASALQNGTINSKTSFLSTGGLRVGSWFFPDWLGGGHGITDVRKSLAWSVNTFYYYIVGGYGNFTGMGVEKLGEYLRKFGFASKLGIDLPGEQDGFIPTKQWKEETLHEKWYVGDSYNVSIGQGNLLVTPLQIADMTAAIANGGTLYKPETTASIMDPITKQETKVDPVIINTNFIDSKNIETVRLGMKDCVDYGSCRRLSSLPFKVAGKTGTAQWNSNKDNHAWFTSFAPFDHPQISVTIMVEEGVEGSAISVPIAYDFYKWWWQYKNTPTNSQDSSSKIGKTQ